ncbi:MAG TPA: ABC transporter substrate-binding protein [Candidatus Acidoferrum sp.]|jgi:NitT/TauT family transport system substrate-binding protein|nr:ABC transporter substrate-binding protein [Candidatus Acidoferrum sp.]
MGICARIAVTVILLLTVSVATAIRPVSSQGLTVIRVIGPSVDGYTPAWVGQKLGIFKKYGIDAQLTIASSGAAASAALVGGAADVSYGNVVSVIQAHAHGVPLQFIAPGGIANAQTGLVHAFVLKDSPIRKAVDLNGKTLASPALHDLDSAMTLAWVDKDGGDSKTIHAVEVPSSAAVPALQAHRADVIVLTEPAASQAAATGVVREIGDTLSVIGGSALVSGYTVVASTAGADADTRARFARAMREAEAYTNAHPRETAEVLAGFSGMTLNEILKTRRNFYPPALDAKILQPLIDVCARYGLIDKGFPASEIISPASVKPR